MRIQLHIGPDALSSDRLQAVLHAKRDRLRAQGVLYARSAGAKNHTRLFMAVSDPAAVDALRFYRGYTAPETQAALREEVMRQLTREVRQARPETLILSAHQLGGLLTSQSEIKRLKGVLSPLSEDIHVVAHIDDPARMLVRRYAAQLMDGRVTGLDLELGLIDRPDWWQAALDTRAAPNPRTGRFTEAQSAVFWLDYKRLQAEWEAVFGTGSVRFRSIDMARLHGPNAAEELRAAFDIPESIGRADPEPLPEPASAAWLTRQRLLNDALLRLLARRKSILPRQAWRQCLNEIRVQGGDIDPGSLYAISDRFAEDIADLCAAHPGLDPAPMAPDAPAPEWREPDPTLGFRATQYLMAFRKRIEKASREETVARAADLAALRPAPEPIATVSHSSKDAAPSAQAPTPELVRQTLETLRRSSFAPHNRLGSVDEEQATASFPPMPPRALPGGSSGNVIVACMKNEAPYIVEWVAYHRATGIDNFLIYTNGCEDGTDEILGRLDALGIVHHRLNDDWKGKSPQQHALNQSLKEEVIRNADWIIHIDVDEFMNVRCGNGTLDDFLAAVPDATNVAMTWRLFGHNGVTGLKDDLVIDQFDTCAPRFCPKPHTVWGFKTMVRNIGAYAKLSCHRPNKLRDDFRDRVKWVNGSGKDMTRDAAENGWRSSKRTVGYDLLQLNHYALRSAESYLVKRQRGRALHVDRSIGINYWIRMDWSDNRDLTIKRNIPRVRAEYDRLLADPVLRDWHDRGFAWHKAKAQELHAMPEFEALYQQALTLKLTETERVAYALTLDMET